MASIVGWLKRAQVMPPWKLSFTIANVNCTNIIRFYSAQSTNPSIQRKCNALLDGRNLSGLSMETSLVSFRVPTSEETVSEWVVVSVCLPLFILRI